MAPAATRETEPKLSPTDPPILLAGLIAARRCGDKMLADVFLRELQERGIEVKFLSAPRALAPQQGGPPR